MQEETILNQKREIGILSSKSKQFQIEISSDKHVSFSRTTDQVVALELIGFSKLGT